jgi:hypothetical protein
MSLAAFPLSVMPHVPRVRVCNDEGPTWLDRKSTGARSGDDWVGGRWWTTELA